MNKRKTDAFLSYEVPTIEQLENELKKENNKLNFLRAIRNTIVVLVVVASVVVLLMTLFMPVLRIYGTSMEPSLESGDIVITLKSDNFQTGDIIAFWYNNKILVKRVIATEGQWVEIDEEGNVKVDGKLLEESYLMDKALGECDIQLPYQVPAGRIFVMGDHRSVSVDSRSSVVGCVGDELIVGKVKLVVWPITRIRVLNG